MAIEKEKIKKPNQSYRRIAYSRQQLRDTIEGSNAVKRKNIMYLPQPAGFDLQSDAPDYSRGTADFDKIKKNAYEIDFDLPWWHQNAAYRIYLQRARFPDITARTSEALQGIATKKSPSFELNELSYLEESATSDGLGLVELYNLLVTEILEQGKITLVVDVDEETNQFYFIVYYAESNIDWNYEYDSKSKRKYLDSSVFVETIDEDDCNYIEYCYNDDGEPVVNRYDKECKMINIEVEKKFDDAGNEIPLGPDDEVYIDNEIKRLGAVPKKLPVFHIGSKRNDAESDHIPLLGVSDISLAIYQKDADLSHAEHLTCSPTLFMFGFNEENRPKSVGAGVAVTNSNPEARAEYTTTDTSGLDHVKKRVEDLLNEAAAYGASMIGSNKNRNEKFETARLRTNHSTSTLVNVCSNVGKAIFDALTFMSEWSGRKNSKMEFEANLDFADHSLDPAELTALVSAWIQNAISHDTLLHNLFKSGKLEEGVTIEDEKEKIANDIDNDLIVAAKELKNMKQIEDGDDEDVDENENVNKDKKLKKDE